MRCWMIDSESDRSNPVSLHHMGMSDESYNRYRNRYK
jgi:hypothetical protein